jgi:hypothetical protein
MSDLAKALNTPVPFEFEGMTFQITPAGKGTFTQFQRWLEGEAFESVRRNRSHFSDAEYREQMASAGRDVASKRYAVGKPAFVEAGQSYEGQREFVRLMLLPRHPQADTELVERMLQDPEASERLRQILETMFPDAQGGDGPKAASG